MEAAKGMPYRLLSCTPLSNSSILHHSNHACVSQVSTLQLGLGTEFRSEKIPRNRLGTISVIPRKKAFIPRHSEFRGRANSEARNETGRNGIPRRNSFTEQQQNNLTKWFVCTSKVVFSDTIFELLACRVLFRAGFSSTEWFGTEFREFASILVPRNGIPSCITNTSIPPPPPPASSILSTRGL